MSREYALLPAFSETIKTSAAADASRTAAAFAARRYECGHEARVGNRWPRKTNVQALIAEIAAFAGAGMRRLVNSRLIVSRRMDK